MFENWIETLGEGKLLALGGLVIGLVFGILAQRSRFCFRAAALESARGTAGGKLAVWLLAFAAAIVLTQAFIVSGVLDVGAARQFAGRASIAGAVLGGLVFGAGMVLARGCPSRLLVLGAGGNLRALSAVLVFAFVALASIGGFLAPLRQSVNSLWALDGGHPALNMLQSAGAANTVALAMGVAVLALAVLLAMRTSTGWRAGLASAGVGVAVALAWWFNYQVSSNSFEIVAVQSLSFTAPAADTMGLVLSGPGQSLNFGIGLIPGVIAGAFLAAAFSRELKVEAFQGARSAGRYLVGAVLMGFGGVVAGGCAVGAGVSGAAVFATTAWVTLFAMWGGAALTDLLVDRSGNVAVRIGRPAYQAG